MYATIVVGTDGSDTAQRAVAEAMRLAEGTDCTIHLVSAFEPLRGVRIVGAPEGAARVWEQRPDDEVQRIIDRTAASIRMKGIAVEPHAVTGDPADALLGVAEHEKADVIVVGSRGMHGVSRMLGSVPNKVSHRARCHVLIVATGND